MLIDSKNAVLSFVKLLSLSLAFALFSQAASAEKASKWELEKENDDLGLKIYTRYIEGSALKEFKAELEVQATIGAIMSVMTDFKRNCEWLASCKEYRMVEQLAPRSNLSYMVQGAPWPVSDRDVVAVSHSSQDPETFQVTVKLEAHPKKLPKVDGLVRVPKMNGFWQFTPINETTTAIVYQAHAEPGGGIPSWLANSVMVDTPHDTLVAFTKQLQKDEYKYNLHPHFENYVAPVTAEQAKAEAEQVEAANQAAAE